MDTITLAAAATETARGWGGLGGIGVALAVFTALVTGHQTWLNRADDDDQDDEELDDDNINIPSPPPPGSGTRGGDTAADLRFDTTDTSGEGMSIEDRAARLLADRVPYNDIARRLEVAYGVSESTAKRAIRRARVPDHTTR